MNFKTFLTALALSLSVAGTPVYAQEIASEVPVETTEITLSTTDAMQQELLSLKTKESDPSTGFFERFFIRLKIRELEHKLNITEAFQ